MNNDDNIKDVANNEGSDPGFMEVPDDFKMGIRVIGPNDDPFETGTNIDDLLYDLAMLIVLRKEEEEANIFTEVLFET